MNMKKHDVSTPSLYRRLRARLRPIRTRFRKIISRLKWPLRVIRIFPYVWRTELKEWQEFRKLRAENADLYQKQTSPLISVVIPTYNRAHYLRERSIPSVLAQTYQNFEIVVVGDHCTDSTEAMLAEINDPRIRFYNLPERPEYPKDKSKLWLIGGYKARNTARQMAKGLWIAHLDDDDVFSPHHLERMLQFVQENDLEFASAQAKMELESGEFEIKGKPPALNLRNKAHSSYFYRTYLRAFSYEQNSWRAGRCDDKQILGKYRRAGVKAGFLEEQTVMYLLNSDISGRTSA